MEGNIWWGYLHENGHIQVKRLFSPEDLIEAARSPFVTMVFKPFQANGREEAIEIIKKRI